VPIDSLANCYLPMALILIDVSLPLAVEEKGRKERMTI